MVLGRAYHHEQLRALQVRAAEARRRFADVLAARDVVRHRVLVTYEAEAQERRSTAVDAAWADSAAKRAQDAAELERLAALHSRLRFDPAGLPAREREALRAGAADFTSKRRAVKRSRL